MLMIKTLAILSLLSALTRGASAEQCGSQAGGKLCPGGQCCSKYGWCGTTPEYCANGCQSQCGGGGGGDVSGLISRATFNQLLKHRNDAGCPAKGFYTYDAFVAAAKSFPAFGTTGDATVRKREIAAFLAQTSHETTGGFFWPIIRSSGLETKSDFEVQTSQSTTSETFHMLMFCL